MRKPDSAVGLIMRMRREITPLEFTVGLIFGGLTISMFALGGGPIRVLVMAIVAAVELHLLTQLRRPDLKATDAEGWLRAAGLLTILAAAFFLVPVMLSGHVKSCFECENDTREGHNYLGTFVFMWMAGAVAGVGGLVSWGISLVRLSGRARLSQ
jgi:hypothetical protein